MPSILIVDDNELQQSLYKGMLGDMPLDITPAGTITDAARLARSQNFDLIIMDIMLPDGSGIDALKDIRTLPDYSTTPIIVISTRASPAIKETLTKAGATDYVAKPVDFTIVADLLRRHLKVEL